MRCKNLVQSCILLIGLWFFVSNMGIDWWFSSSKRTNDGIRDISFVRGPKGCRRTYTFVFSSQWGFGSELNNLIFCAAFAHRKGRTLLIDGSKWNYNDYHLYFEPVNPDCAGALLGKKTEHRYEEDQLPRIWTIRGHNQWGNIRFFWQDYADILQDQEFRDIAQNLYVLKPEIKAEVDEYVSRVTPFEGPYFAVHIRAGDKVNETREWYPLVNYTMILDQLIAKDRNMNQRNPNVFIASDDFRNIQNITRMKPNWNILYIPSPFIRDGHFQEIYNRNAFEYKYKMTIFLLAELEMMKRADQVLCTLSSNVCTFVQMMRNQSVETLHSMDEQMNLYYFLPGGFHYRGIMEGRGY